MLVETDDTALLSLFENKATRNEGFKRLLDKYSRQLYYFLRRMGLDHDDADESLQDAFVRFWRAGIIDEPGNSIQNVLYRLATEKCLTKNVKVPFNGLTATQFLILVLKEKEGFDFTDIAQIVSVPVNEVRRLFKTGITKLNDQPNIKKEK